MSDTGRVLWCLLLICAAAWWLGTAVAVAVFGYEPGRPWNASASASVTVALVDHAVRAWKGGRA